MATRGGDGSIVLTTKVDTTGVSQGNKTIRNIMSDIASVLKTTGAKIQTTFTNIGTKMQTTFEKAKAKISAALSSLMAQLALVFSVRVFWNFSKAAGEMATQQEANVQRLIDIYGEASIAVGDYIDSNARAIGMSRNAAASFSAVYGNLFSVWADQKTNAALTTQYLNMTAVVASKTGRTVEDVQERVRSGLLGNTEAIEDLGIFVNVKTIEMTDAFKRMADGRSWEQLGAYEQQQVRTLAILEQATQKYGDEVTNTTTLTKAQYKAAYEDMQATWGQFVNVVLIPVLQIVTQIFNVITAGLRAIAGITGKTIEVSQVQSNAADDTSKSIGNAADSQKALTDETKKTAKEQKKMLAGFDEIQILSQGSSGSGSTNSGINGGASVEYSESGESGGGQEEGISSMLATIMGVVGGAMVALGVLLLWNGQIGWGIGFIIAGAATLGVSAAAVGNANIDFSQQFSSIMTMVGGALLALGLVLFFKTKSSIAHKIGLGMIVAGAGVLAIGAVQIAANKVGGEIGTMLHGIITVVSGFLLAIGVIMLFCGQITPLSIGLIITGAVGLVSEIALYPEAVVEALRGWVGGVLAIISTALLVIGIILCVCGIVTPISIGMIVIGAVGLVAELTLNWNFVCEQVTKFFQENAGLIVGVSVALIIIGIILLFTGVGIPLAIGLIVAGGGALAATVALNWNFIVDKVKEVWDKIKQFWNENIAPIFTAEWWKQLGIDAINGLIAGFEGGINAIVGAFEDMLNWIIDSLNKISVKVPDGVPGIGGKTFGFDINNVSFDEITIPRLARGAVIPPNREFLAVLGDQKHGVNIETPLETMVQAFELAMNNRGRGEGSSTVIIEIDGREFGRAVVKHGNNETRRVGARLVTAR